MRHHLLLVCFTGSKKAGEYVVFPAQVVVMAIPPRLALPPLMTWEPSLPAELAAAAKATPTWMGHTTKVSRPCFSNLVERVHGVIYLDSARVLQYGHAHSPVLRQCSNKAHSSRALLMVLPAREKQVLVTYSRPFWRELGMSGNAMSYGDAPIDQLYDSCGPNGGEPPHALCGFVFGNGAREPPADDVLRREVRAR